MRAPSLLFALSLLLPASGFAVTRTWTGAASRFWSDPQNWSPAGVPAPDDQLIFPRPAANASMTNDLPAGATVGPMTFNTAYTLSGNPLTLTDDLSFDLFFGALVCNADLVLAAPVKLGAAFRSTYNGAIDVNGKTLTIDSSGTILAGPLNGNGEVVLNGKGLLVSGKGSFAGTIRGSLNVQGSIPNATVISDRLSGSGTVGNTTAGQLSPGDEFVCCGTPPNFFGTLHTKSLVLNGPTKLDLSSFLVMDQLQVQGTVTVSGSLAVDMPVAPPAEGRSFVIIDNDGTDAVNGTFSGLPEGATFSSLVFSQNSNTIFSISYRGGDGNDVVVRVVGPTISISGAQIAEGNSGTTTVSVPVTLSSPSLQPVSVSFTTIAGSAASGVDYEAASGVIEFAPGQQTRSVELHVIGDTLPEPDETFFVRLLNPINATVVSPLTVTVIIVNDEPASSRRRAARH